MKSNDGNKNKGYSKIATIIGIVFIIYFIASIGGMVYYSKRNPMMCLFLFGTYFLILGSLGVLSIINEKTVKKNLVIFIFPLVGIGVVIYSSISMWGNITISEKAAPFILLLVFIITGAVILLKTILSSKIKQKIGL